MTTPTPPADAPTPRTDAVNECAKRLILNRPFGSSTADLLQELADLYSKHAESLERFLGSALANNDPLREKVIEFQRELAAKDARIAALEKDRDEFHGQYRMKCDVETKTLHIELADLRAQLQAANERAEKAEHQSKLAWERHAEKDRAYGQALEARDAATARAESWARDCGHQADQYSSLNASYQQLSDLYAASEQTNAALTAEVERLTKNIGCARQQGSTQFCAEAFAAIAKRDAARALNDTLAGALKRFHDDAATSHENARQIGVGDAYLIAERALSAYAKSKEAQP